MIFKQGEMVDKIDVNVLSAEDNLKNATNEIKDANDAYGDQDGMLNKVCVAVVIIVAILLIMMILLPD